MAGTGCKPRLNDFSRYENIDTDGWQYGDTLFFDIEVQDSVVQGNLNLNIRHTNDYPYQNLWIEIIKSDSMSIVVDTLNIPMSDMYGHWYGRGIGTDFQLTRSLGDSIELTTGTRLKVRHIMRTDRLTGLEQIGIEFTELRDHKR